LKDYLHEARKLLLNMLHVIFSQNLYQGAPKL
jgi:hypothetical protein